MGNLGILKAGAEFSVLDPACPDDQQCMYLDVAQLKGLISIAKTLQEEGGISGKVHSWINQHLDLRIEVPALEILDAGTMTGGVSTHDDGNDCLSTLQHIKEKHPGVLVGPDSQPTLSFMSGSDGRSKGVRARHFSLTYHTP